MRILEMRGKIQDIESKKQSALFFKLFLESVLAQLSTHQIKHDPYALAQIMTTQAFNQRLKVNATALRMNIPPPYRPNFKLIEPNKKCNGGMAIPPQKLKGGFNSITSASRPDTLKCAIQFGK